MTVLRRNIQAWPILLLNISRTAGVVMICGAAIIGTSCTEYEPEEQAAFIQIMDGPLLKTLDDLLTTRRIPHSIEGDRLLYPYDQKYEVERAFSESLAAAPRSFMLPSQTAMEYFLTELDKVGIIVLSFGPEERDGQLRYRVNVRNSDQEIASKVFQAAMKVEAMRSVPDMEQQ